MFRELLDLSRDLGQRSDFPPPGFYQYSTNAPIRWVARIKLGTPPEARLIPLELYNPRPFSGRTSGFSDAYPLADEAGYVFGIGKDGDKKSLAFFKLLEKMLEAPELSDPMLSQAVALVDRIIRDGRLAADPSIHQLDAKDWIAFAMAEGPLSNQFLFEHPAVQRFWFRHLRDITNAATKGGDLISGECSVCGVEQTLPGRIPLGVKLGIPNPLVSQNADAYVSRVEGRDAFKRAALCLCLECGDAAARALNYLSNDARHHRQLIAIPNKNGDLDNYHALFWLRRAPIPRDVARPIADLSALLNAIPALMERAKDQPPQPVGSPTVLSQLEDLLKLPWSLSDHAAALSEEGFYLLLVSPNQGRIAVRDWIAVSLGSLRRNLTQFLDALRIVGPDGTNSRAFTVPMILDALKRPKSQQADADDTRGLLRAAYLGERPDWALLARALIRFRSALRGLDDRSTNPRELPPSLRFHICAAVLKLFCLFGKEDANDMATLEDRPPYLCGRLLAVLEEVQRRAAGKTKLNVTLVERLYGAAAMTPAATLSMAISRAQVGHLPKLRRERRGYDQMQQMLQEISGSLAAHGGLPPALDPVAQAEFALGYYTERAKFNPIPGTTMVPTDKKGAEA